MARWETTGPFSLDFGRTGLFIRAKILLESGIANQREQMRRGIKNLAAIIMVTAVAACAPAPSPPPAMPLPPGGAALSMTIPPLGLDGVRATPNRGLSRDEQIWHFRSALNVAALNCQVPIWGRIATEYNKFIVIHKAILSRTSKAVDREYVARYPGKNGLRVRDTRMTDLYNYFALPPVRAQYCAHRCIARICAWRSG